MVEEEEVGVATDSIGICTDAERVAVAEGGVVAVVGWIFAGRKQ